MNYLEKRRGRTTLSKPPAAPESCLLPLPNLKPSPKTTDSPYGIARNHFATWGIMKTYRSFNRIVSPSVFLACWAALMVPPQSYAADPNAQTIENAAASLAAGIVSDDFPNAMSGLVSDASPDKCSAFGEAVSAGLQAAATQTEVASIASTAPDVVGMSQSVATSLLSLFTSYCSAPPAGAPAQGTPGPNITINIKDCNEIRAQLDQCKRDLDNAKRDIADFKAELGKCQENVKNLLAKMAEKDALIAQLQKELAEKDAEIQSLKDQLKTCKADADHKKCKEAEAAYNDLSLRISQGQKILDRLEDALSKLPQNSPHIPKYEAEIDKTRRDLQILIDQQQREAGRIKAHCGNNGGAQNPGGNVQNPVRNNAPTANNRKPSKDKNPGKAKKPSGSSRTKR